MYHQEDSRVAREVTGRVDMGKDKVVMDRGKDKDKAGMVDKEGTLDKGVMYKEETTDLLLQGTSAQGALAQGALAEEGMGWAEEIKVLLNLIATTTPSTQTTTCQSTSPITLESIQVCP